MRNTLVLLIVSLCLTPVFTVAGEKSKAMDNVDIARRMRPYVWEHSIFDSAEHVADVMLKSNANAIRFSAISQHGNYVFYDSKFFPKHPGLDRDLLRELADEFKKHDDLHLFPYNSLGYCVNAQICEKQDPDWRQVTADGSYIPASWAGMTGYWVCLNNPGYVNTYAEACKEIVEKYGVSGMYFDGPRWGDWGGGGNCYCQFCRKVIADKYGVEADNSMLDKHRSEINAQGFKYAMTTITKAIKSVRDIPVIYNHSMDNPGLYDLMDITDGGLVAEIHRGQSSFMNVFKLIKSGAAFDKARWAYSPPGNYNDFVTYDNLDPMIFGMTELAHGCTPIVETMHPYMYDESGIPSIREMFTMMEQNEDLYFEYKPVPFVAMPFSRQCVARVSDYEIYWRGAMAALTHAHQHSNAILDKDITLENLKKYKAVFLTNMACMSDKQIEAIKTYVREGGGLIATFQTSLYDENGNIRENLALKDLFQANYESLESPSFEHAYGPRVYFRMAKQHPITKGIGKNKRIAYDYLFVANSHPSFARISPLEGAEVIADAQYVVDDPEWVGSDGCFMPPYTLKNGPAAIIASTYGKGRVVYIAPALEMLYDARGFRLVRKLLSNAVDWVTDNTRPVKIEGPACLVTNLTELGDKRALHFINYTGNNHENPSYKVDWVAPLYNLEATIKNPEGKKLQKAILLNTGQELTFESNGEHTTMIVPELDVYECIMLDYK